MVRSYNRVAAFARVRQEQRALAQQTTLRGTFVPLTFGAGEAFQFDWSGNPPDKPKVREVEFSKKEVLREEVEIYRQPDHGCLEAC